MIMGQGEGTSRWMGRLEGAGRGSMRRGPGGGWPCKP